MCELWMMSLEVMITLWQTRDILGGLRSNDHHRLEVMMMMKNAYAKTKWIILLIKDLPYQKQNYDDEECVCKAQNGYPTLLQKDYLTSGSDRQTFIALSKI